MKPKKGDALMFYNLLETGRTDGYSMHAGCPVTKGASVDLHSSHQLLLQVVPGPPLAEAVVCDASMRASPPTCHTTSLAATDVSTDGVRRREVDSDEADPGEQAAGGPQHRCVLPAARRRARHHGAAQQDPGPPSCAMRAACVCIRVISLSQSPLTCVARPQPCWAGNAL